MKPERAGLFRHSTLLLLWLIAGGTQSVWPQSDNAAKPEIQQLQGKLEAMFPAMEIRPAYAWAGTFGDTKDSLSYIGTLPSARNILFALCYGANGTNFAMIGANLARDWICQRRNRDRALFGLDR